MPEYTTERLCSRDDAGEPATVPAMKGEADKAVAPLPGGRSRHWAVSEDTNASWRFGFQVAVSGGGVAVEPFGLLGWTRAEFLHRVLAQPLDDLA